MTAPIQPTPGTVFGGEFKIVRNLSSGGMGAVYIAEQASTGTLRALKLMHPQLVADPKMRERFVQEARVGSLIKSDHVVQVIGAGIDQASGAPWMAMELLEGEDLSSHLRRTGRLQPAELCAIYRQLCHALGAAHAAGIVHRDVKPENIFLAKTRSVSAPISIKVLDFGIAKVFAESKTMATEALGTPLWMAPEQTDPRAPITAGTDVWSLGLIAFMALTGRSYWNSASDPHASLTVVMREILFEPIAPASVRAAELGRAGVIPPGFDAWFARCLNREPSLRFASASEAFAALEPALFGSTGALGAPLSTPPGPAHAPTFPSMDGGRLPPTSSGVGAASGPLAALPTADYLAMQGASSTTGAPVMSTPASPFGTGFHPASGSANPAAMGLTGGPYGHAPRRGKGLAIALGGLALGTVIAVGAVLVNRETSTVTSVTSRGGAEGSEAARSERETGAAAVQQPSSNAQGSPAVTGRPTGATPASMGGPASGGSPAGGTTKPAVPTATAAPSAAPSASPSAAATAGPFNHAAAAKSVQQAGSNAKFHCKGKDGPKVVSATVYFNPNGAVQRVSVDPMIASKPSSLCVSMMLSSARVPPFDGSELQPYSTAVGIE